MSRIDRRVSLDIDVLQLIERAQVSGITAPNVLYVPLTLMVKGLLVDFDVFDQDGTALSITTSDQDSHAAQAILLAAAHSFGFDPAGFSEGMLQKLLDIVRDMPSEADIAAISPGQNISQRAVSAWHLPLGYGVNSSDERKWSEMFAHEDFVKLVANLTTNFLPKVGVDANNPPDLLKYRISESTPVTNAGGSPVAEKIGISQLICAIDAPSLGRAQREHMRILSPGGTFVNSVIVRRVTGSDSTNPRLVPARPGDKYIRRLTPDRALIYTRDTDPGPYEVQIGLRPLLEGFRTPALFGMFACTVLLAAGSIAQFTSSVLDHLAEKSEASVAILVIVPSILAAYVAHEGEHETRGQLLKVPRWLLVITSILTISGAVALIVNPGHLALGIIWAVFALLCLICLVTVASICRVIAKVRRRVVNNSNRQHSFPILS